MFVHSPSELLSLPLEFSPKPSSRSVSQSSCFSTTPRPSSECLHFIISPGTQVIGVRRNSQQFQICFCYKWMHPAIHRWQKCIFQGRPPGTRVWSQSAWEFQDEVGIAHSCTQSVRRWAAPLEESPFSILLFLSSGKEKLKRLEWSLSFFFRHKKQWAWFFAIVF